jgi:hypothetical protein
MGVAQTLQLIPQSQTKEATPLSRARHWHKALLPNAQPYGSPMAKSGFLPASEELAIVKRAIAGDAEGLRPSSLAHAAACSARRFQYSVTKKMPRMQCNAACFLHTRISDRSKGVQNFLHGLRASL